MMDEKEKRFQYIYAIQYWTELIEEFNRHYNEIHEENYDDYGEVSGDVGGA